MANETEYSNYQVVSAYIAGNVVPAMLAKTFSRAWCMIEQVQGDAKSAIFKKLGSLTAYTIAESAQATKSEYTETGVTLTAVKSKVFSQVSEESQLYIGSRSVENIIDAAANAIARKDNTDFLALATGFNSGNTVGSTGAALSTDALLLATHKLRLNNIDGEKAFFLHSKQFQEIADELKDANKPELFANQSGFLARGGNIEPLSAVLFGLPVFVSNLVSNDTTDHAGMLLSQYAIGKVEANGGEPIVKLNDNVEYGLTDIGMSAFYIYGEVLDLGGCKILSGV